ncbi:MAG: hypothetical protein L3J03_08885 [Desulfobacterales bacterium]|nr:hypothetical protein [Desulfobacterales bacterium]
MMISKINPAQLGFDIDGVVADTAEAFMRIARDEYGANGITVEDITEFEAEQCLDMDPKIIDAIFHRLVVEPLAADLRPMENAIPVLRELAEVAPLTFVTARPLGAPIIDWLRTMLGAEVLAGARVKAIGDHDNKARYIKKLGLDYFVDDRAETCLQLAREEIQPIVYCQPWNRGRHNLQTVADWQAIRSLVFD